MILKIYKWPSEKLRERAEPVYGIDDTVKQQVNDLFETMYSDRGIGLSATQCGLSRRIIVIDTTKLHAGGEKLALINPVIVSEEMHKTETEEGCLSFPGVFVTVARQDSITVSYFDADGEPLERQFNGIESVCIQHEIDHLDGKVFIDYLSELRRNRLLKKMRKKKHG